MSFLAKGAKLPLIGVISRHAAFSRVPSSALDSALRALTTRSSNPHVANKADGQNEPTATNTPVRFMVGRELQESSNSSNGGSKTNGDQDNHERASKFLQNLLAFIAAAAVLKTIPGLINPALDAYAEKFTPDEAKKDPIAALEYICEQNFKILNYFDLLKQTRINIYKLLPVLSVFTPLAKVALFSSCALSGIDLYVITMSHLLNKLIKENKDIIRPDLKMSFENLIEPVGNRSFTSLIVDMIKISLRFHIQSLLAKKDSSKSKKPSASQSDPLNNIFHSFYKDVKDTFTGEKGQKLQKLLHATKNLFSRTIVSLQSQGMIMPNSSFEQTLKASLILYLVSTVGAAISTQQLKSLNRLMGIYKASLEYHKTEAIKNLDKDLTPEARKVKEENLQERYELLETQYTKLLDLYDKLLKEEQAHAKQSLTYYNRLPKDQIEAINDIIKPFNMSLEKLLNVEGTETSENYHSHKDTPKTSTVSGTEATTDDRITGAIDPPDDPYDLDEFLRRIIENFQTSKTELYNREKELEQLLKNVDDAIDAIKNPDHAIGEMLLPDGNFTKITEDISGDFGERNSFLKKLEDPSTPELGTAGLPDSTKALDEILEVLKKAGIISNPNSAPLSPDVAKVLATTGIKWDLLCKKANAAASQKTSE